MAIRVFWAEPGPEADEALRRYWARAFQVAGEIVVREKLNGGRTAERDETEPKPISE